MMDHYRFLGVSRTASQEEIKAAYHRLAKKWHPDKNPDRKEEATRRFKELGNAYDVLKDPVSRRAYDATLGTATPSGQKRSADASEDTTNKKAKPNATPASSGWNFNGFPFTGGSFPFGGTGVGGGGAFSFNNCTFTSTTGNHGTISSITILPCGTVTTVWTKFLDGKKVITTQTIRNGKITETVKTED